MTPHLLRSSIGLTPSPFFKVVKAIFIFSLRPDGGSFVNLIHFSKIPTGILSLGSADKNNLKSSCPFSLAISFIFSSKRFSHFGIK